MEFVVALLILSSLFLTALTLISLRLFETLKAQTAENTKLAKLQQDSVKHLSNLLASKDPLAFQQVNAASIPADTEYTGPIVSGDELELLEAYADEIDSRFGLNNG